MNRLRAGVAFLILVLLSGTGLWIGLSGAPVSGGIPFLPDRVNQGVGRVVFAAGGIFCAWMAVLALRDAVGRRA